MALSYSKSLLVACKSMHWYVPGGLLETGSGGTEKPKANAAGKKIARILQDIKKDDDDFGLHHIYDILENLRWYCYEAGNSLTIAVPQLLDGDVISDIDSLALYVQANTESVSP